MRVQSSIIDHFTLVLMEHFFMANLQGYIMCVKELYCHFPYDYTWNNA